MNSKFKYKEISIDGKSFLKICESKEIFEGKGKRFFYGNDNDMQFAVFRVGGKLYCLNNICPHRHQDRMHEGIIMGMNVMCPAHGWTYSLVDGKNVSKKQGVKSLDAYEIFEKNGYVFVEKPSFSPAKWKSYDDGEL